MPMYATIMTPHKFITKSAITFY